MIEGRDTYFSLINNLNPEGDLKWSFHLGSLKVLPSESEVDNPGEGSWYIVYDTQCQDELRYGYYRFSQSIGEFPNQELANMFMNCLIKNLEEDIDSLKGLI